MPTWSQRTFGDTFGAWFGIIEPDRTPPEPPPRLQGAFLVHVYDKNFQHRGWVGGYTSLTVTKRHNAISTADLVLPSDHLRVPDLMAPGARLVIDYDGEFLVSGRITGRDGRRFDDAAGGPAITFHLTSDFAKLSEILGWPNPTGGIDDQGAATAYYSAAGAAESVVKTLVSVNANRLGMPLTVVGSSGRGASIKVQIRMHELVDRLLPVVDQAGIGIDIRQYGSGLRLDCYEPTVHDEDLSEASGALVDWSWSQNDETATHLVVAGSGEGTAREFRQYIDTARRTKLGDTIERFVDARDVDTTDELDARAAQQFTETGELYGISVTLAETNSFRYGKFHVGDTVTVEGYTDVCREVTIADTIDSGVHKVQVVPSVGDADNASPNQKAMRGIVGAIAALSKWAKNMNAGR